MKIKTTLFLTILAFSFWTTEAVSSIRYETYAGGVVNVHVLVGRMTEVVFPEPIAQLGPEAPEEILALEAQTNSLFMFPKEEVSIDIFVVTVSGKKIALNMVFKDPHDLRLFVSYPDLKENEQNKEIHGQRGVNYTVSLLKTLLSGRDINGATAHTLNEIFFKNEYVEITLRKKYELNAGYALVAEIENLVSRPIVVPIQHVSFKKLRAIASDEEVLAPNGKKGSRTNIYMVVAK